MAKSARVYYLETLKDLLTLKLRKATTVKEVTELTRQLIVVNDELAMLRGGR